MRYSILTQRREAVGSNVTDDTGYDPYGGTALKNPPLPLLLLRLVPPCHGQLPNPCHGQLPNPNTLEALMSFFQRAALTVLALFMCQCLVLLKLIFGSSPAWLVIGEIITMLKEHAVFPF